MSETGWVSIVTLIMSGIGTMFAAWVSLRQQQLGEKVDLVAAQTDGVGEKLEAVTKKTDVVTEAVVETKAQVVENMRKLDGRLTLLISETEKRADQEGYARAMKEAQAVALAVLESDKAAREKALAEAQHASPAIAPPLPTDPSTKAVTLVVSGTMQEDEAAPKIDRKGDTS